MIIYTYLHLLFLLSIPGTLAFIQPSTFIPFYTRSYPITTYGKCNESHPPQCRTDIPLTSKGSGGLRVHLCYNTRSRSVRLPGLSLSADMSGCRCLTCVTRMIERGLDKTVGFGVEGGYSDACWENGWCDLIPRCLVKLKHVFRMEESKSWLIAGFGIALTVGCMAYICMCMCISACEFNATEDRHWST